MTTASGRSSSRPAPSPRSWACPVRGSRDGTGTSAYFWEPPASPADGTGNLYVADGANYTIRKVVVATRVVTTIAGTSGTWGSTDGTGAAALFDGPSGVALDGAGNLYVADPGNHTIRKVVDRDQGGDHSGLGRRRCLRRFTAVRKASPLMVPATFM